MPWLRGSTTFAEVPAGVGAWTGPRHAAFAEQQEFCTAAISCCALNVSAAMNDDASAVHANLGTLGAQ